MNNLITNPKNLQKQVSSSKDCQLFADGRNSGQKFDLNNRTNSWSVSPNHKLNNFFHAQHSSTESKKPDVANSSRYSGREQDTQLSVPRICQDLNYRSDLNFLFEISNSNAKAKHNSEKVDQKSPKKSPRKTNRDQRRPRSEKHETSNVKIHEFLNSGREDFLALRNSTIATTQLPGDSARRKKSIRPSSVETKQETPKTTGANPPPSPPQFSSRRKSTRNASLDQNSKKKNSTISELLIKSARFDSIYENLKNRSQNFALQNPKNPTKSPDPANLKNLDIITTSSPPNPCLENFKSSGNLPNSPLSSASPNNHIANHTKYRVNNKYRNNGTGPRGDTGTNREIFTGKQIFRTEGDEAEGWVVGVGGGRGFVGGARGKEGGGERQVWMERILGKEGGGEGGG